MDFNQTDHLLMKLRVMFVLTTVQTKVQMRVAMKYAELAFRMYPSPPKEIRNLFWSLHKCTPPPFRRMMTVSWVRKIARGGSHDSTK